MHHIGLPTRSEILKLAAARCAPSVTIFVSTTPATQAAQADQTALKNLAKEALRQLEAAATTTRMLGPRRPAPLLRYAI